MQSITEVLKTQWAQNLYQVNFEKQEYILTPEEEQGAIEYAVNQEAHKLFTKFKSIGVDEDEAEKKVVNLINIDKEKVLERANSNKHHALWEIECRMIEKKQGIEKYEAMKKAWTASALFQHLKYSAKIKFNEELKVNDHTLGIIKTLCFFISEDERFETELKLDFKKGILFRGKSGLGKTFIPMCLSDNGLKPIVLLNIIEITDKVKENGYFESPKKDGILYIDDIGTEESPIIRWGTPVNWFKEFIEKYHFNKLPFNKLIISTNLNTDQIDAKYGYRVRSRIREMFNVVDLTGEDLR